MIHFYNYFNTEKSISSAFIAELIDLTFKTKRGGIYDNVKKFNTYVQIEKRL